MPLPKPISEESSFDQVGGTFALTVSYDGTDYGGWQRQSNAVGVQEILESAIAAAVEHPVSTLASGRTDAGVHAVGQVVRCRLERWRHSGYKLVPSINRHLPPAIAVREARRARADFHPIRHAIDKTYRYRIRLARSPDPLSTRYEWFMPRPVDIPRLIAAAKRLEGTHDFIAFESMGSPRENTVRTMHAIDVRVDDAIFGQVLTIDMRANGFLYNMARRIIGTLIYVATANRDVQWIDRVLDQREKRLAHQSAPAAGLMLMHVTYPEELFIE